MFLLSQDIKTTGSSFFYEIEYQPDALNVKLCVSYNYSYLFLFGVAYLTCPEPPPLLPLLFSIILLVSQAFCCFNILTISITVLSTNGQFRLEYNSLVYDLEPFCDEKHEYIKIFPDSLEIFLRFYFLK